MSEKKIDPRLGRMDRLIYPLPVSEQAELLKNIWKNKMGYELDLEHPKTFTEKLQWYKLYYHHPDMTRCVDKVTFKDYIAEKLGEGYTAKLLRVWNSPDDVNFDSLPRRFVVKSNCQDNGKYIAIVLDKDSYDFSALEQEIVDYWFEPANLLINGFCSAYHAVEPKVLVEEFIEHETEAPEECKVFCFGGKPMFCYVTKEHFQDGEVNIGTHPYGFYTTDWKLIDVTYGSHQVYRDAMCPKGFSKMLEIAKRLSADFPFVRVDFFNVDLKFYLAELTFYPGGGFVKYDPPEFDLYMGNMFQINQA